MSRLKGPIPTIRKKKGNRDGQESLSRGRPTTLSWILNSVFVKKKQKTVPLVLPLLLPTGRVKMKRVTSLVLNSTQWVIPTTDLLTSPPVTPTLKGLEDARRVSKRWRDTGTIDRWEYELETQQRTLLEPRYIKKKQKQKAPTFSLFERRYNGTILTLRY